MKFEPFYLIIMFIVLPLIGFPIMPFLFLLGMEFGRLWGVVVMLAVMPLHLIVSYGMAVSYFRKWLLQFARKRQLHLPQVPKNREYPFAFLFMIVPGLSYSMKNYLLPLTGLRFFPYFLSGWISQGLMGIPMVVVGNEASRWNIPILIGIIVLVVVYAIVVKFRSKQRKTENHSQTDRHVI